MQVSLSPRKRIRFGATGLRWSLVDARARTKAESSFIRQSYPKRRGAGRYASAAAHQVGFGH
jgi:hypothetical protein